MLDKITVDNFKSLKHLEYDCAGLNLLTGMNGAGKSSFVQMLRLMREVAKDATSNDATSLCLLVPTKELGAEINSRDFLYCYRGLAKCGFAVDFSLMSGSPARCSFQRVIKSGGEGRWNSLCVEHPEWQLANENCYGDYDDLRIRDIDGDLSVTKEQIDAEEVKASLAIKKECERMRNAEATDSKAFAELWRGMRFVDAFRLKPDDVHLGGKYSSLYASLCGLQDKPFDAEGRNVAEYIYKCGIGEDTNELLDKVNVCLDWVSPGARLSVSEKDVGGQEYFIESVGFGSESLARQYKPQHVGFGISYILPVLVTLLSAKPGCILVIENPEAHLHPRGQAEMGRLIAETVARGVQVFVETHSDHLINGVRVAVKKGVVKPTDVNIAFFERKPHDVQLDDGTTRREIYTEVTNIKVDDAGSLSQWPKDFMDEWGIRQMELLRAR